MKTLIYIIGFVTILAGSTYFVAPQFRGYHEGKLKLRAEEVLQRAGYMDVEVEMNHLHASNIVIQKDEQNAESVEGIEKKAEQLVRSIPGIHTDRQYIRVTSAGDLDTRVEVILAKGNARKDGKSFDPLVGKSELASSEPIASKNIAKDMRVESTAKAEPMAEPKSVQVSSELYVEWNDSKDEINLDGKISSKDQRGAIVAPLEKKFGADAVEESLIISSKLVKSSMYLKDFSPLIPEFVSICRGAGSIKFVDQPGRIELRGGLVKRDDYTELEERLAFYRNKKITVVNSLKYFPEFGVEKDDGRGLVILSGYADKNNSVNLSSYVKRFTQQKENQYTFKSEISPDRRCEEYVWKASDQDLLDKYLTNVVRGKLMFRNDKIAEVSGVTANAEYQRRLKEEMVGTGVEYSLIYDPEIKPIAAGTKDEAEPGGDIVESEAQAQAKERLKDLLKDYKIYFGSGKKRVNAKFNTEIAKIAEAILKSEDQTSLIVIGGFADLSGSAAANAALSKERAVSVQVKLIALGVPINRTKIEFFGAEKASREKWRSRRVEIRVR